MALNGTPYYEFVLDINQDNSATGQLLSLDQLRLYVSPTNIDTAPNNFANGYNPATGTLGGLSPSYDMNPGLSSTNFVELNGALKPGSGTLDMTLFVPVSDLGTNPNSFVYLYSQFGGHAFTSDQGNTGGAANDGFEEWANTTVEVPTLATRAGPTVVLGSGVPLTDAATLAGGNNPTGTIAFTLTGPGGGVVYTDVVPVSGNGTYDTSQGNNPGGFLPTAAGTYQWLARYSGDANNPAAASAFGDEPQTVNPATPQADLGLSKTVNDPTPNVGDTVVFTVTLTNHGPDPATNVQVSEPLPVGLAFIAATPSQGWYDSNSGVWAVGTVADGASAVLTVSAWVTDPGALPNTATVSHSDQFDPNPDNNRATAEVVPQQADLRLTKAVDNPQPTVGGTVTFTFVIHNQGPDAATGVLVGDPFPRA